MSEAETAAINGEDRSTELKITIEQTPPIEVPAEKRSIPWAKVAGGIITASVLAGVAIAPQRYVIAEVRAVGTQTDAKIEKSQAAMKESLRVHGENPHPSAVPREVYNVHVKQADERHKESKDQRKEILKKLDHIGRRTHGEKKWERVQDDK